MAAAQALGAGSARPAMAAAPGETPLLQVHAEGAQIYECKADAEGGLAWVLREPIASLFLDGKTVGHHYAGPRWELSDGSSVSGKVVGKSPGDGPADIHWLKLPPPATTVEGWSPASRHSAHQYARRRTRRRLRDRGRVSERGVLGGLRVPEEMIGSIADRVERRSSARRFARRH